MTVLPRESQHARWFGTSNATPFSVHVYLHFFLLFVLSLLHLSSHVIHPSVSLSLSLSHTFFVSFPSDLHILFFLSLCLSIYLYRLPSFSHTREGVRIQIKEPTWNSEQVLPVEHNTDANTREHFLPFSLTWYLLLSPRKTVVCDLIVLLIIWPGLLLSPRSLYKTCI